MKKIILHLCADTGSDSKPYADDPEYEVIRIGSDIGVENYHPPVGVYGIFANPPCTEFSTARSDGKARLGEDGLRLVRECQRIINEAGDVKFWVIENPARGVLRDFIGEPMLTYQPWEYGSPWTKHTALWGKFNVPSKKYTKWGDVPKIDGLYTRKSSHNRRVLVPKPALAFLHKSAYDLIEEFQTLPRPTSDMEFRSLCSQKFAQAFYQVNK